jgi:hypothetical protein
MINKIEHEANEELKYSYLILYIHELVMTDFFAARLFDLLSVVNQSVPVVFDK